MKKFILIAGVVLVFAACSGKNTKVNAYEAVALKTMAEITSCTYIGDVVGEGKGGYDMEILAITAMDDAKEKALKIGGNAVINAKSGSILDKKQKTIGRSVTARVYRCP